MGAFSEAQLIELTMKTDRNVRLDIVKKLKNIPANVCFYLSRDPDKEVRYLLASRLDIPNGILFYMRDSDPDKYIRTTATSTIIKIKRAYIKEALRNLTQIAIHASSLEEKKAIREARKSFELSLKAALTNEHHSTRSKIRT